MATLAIKLMRSASQLNAGVVSMEVLQGRYVAAVESSKGQLKSLQIETDSGVQIVHLPKSLRVVAQQELNLGEPVRIWATADLKRPKAISKKRSKKTSASKALAQTALCAVQIVPLQPKSTVSVPASLSQAPKLMVQLCQRKNCCKRGGDELWQAFAAARQSQGRPFKLEAVGCLGGCKQGPNIRILPANVKQRRVKPADIAEILQHY
jgi:hypothetical protein